MLLLLRVPPQIGKRPTMERADIGELGTGGAVTENQ
jgi:hypothetical protein